MKHLDNKKKKYPRVALFKILKLIKLYSFYTVAELTMSEKDKNGKEYAALSLIMACAFALIFVAMLFAIVVIRKLCAPRNSSNGTKNSKNNSKIQRKENGLVVESFGNSKPDILNKGTKTNESLKDFVPAKISKTYLISVTDGNSVRSHKNETEEKILPHSPYETIIRSCTPQQSVSIPSFQKCFCDYLFLNFLFLVDIIGVS